MPVAPSARAQVIADLSSVTAFDEDGNEIIEEGEDFLAYQESVPPREERRRFKEPVFYWEPRYPGCFLQPYPRTGQFYSTDSGVWMLEYPYQERAVRTHILQSTRVDPDLLKVTADELAVMNGKEHPTLKRRYCQTGACSFVTCSQLATDLHEELTGHTTKNKPRED
jgi:hypothetical protein